METNVSSRLGVGKRPKKHQSLNPKLEGCLGVWGFRVSGFRVEGSAVELKGLGVRVEGLKKVNLACQDPPQILNPGLLVSKWVFRSLNCAGLPRKSGSTCPREDSGKLRGRLGFRFRVLWGPVRG